MMSRLLLSSSIGLMCAVLFTIGRGGWHDAPFVVPVFALSGFAFTYVTASLIHYEPAVARRFASLQHGNVRLARDVVAAIVVASSLYWGGLLIQGAGFAGWLVAIFLGVSLPLAVCLITTRATIVYGVSTASCLTISTIVNHPTFSHRTPLATAWDHFFHRELSAWVAIWGILLALSFAVSVPLAIQRGRISNR